MTFRERFFLRWLIAEGGVWGKAVRPEMPNRGKEETGTICHQRRSKSNHHRHCPGAGLPSAVVFSGSQVGRANWQLLVSASTHRHLHDSMDPKQVLSDSCSSQRAPPHIPLKSAETLWLLESALRLVTSTFNTFWVKPQTLVP